MDFGAGSDPSAAFAVQRRFVSKGPLVNSEFYPGWLDHWGGKHAHVGTEPIIKSLGRMLDLGANVNLYMVHGGTSFGFNAGANSAPFAPQPTSYDYDSPISEAGDLTDKYVAIRDFLKNYTKQIKAKKFIENISAIAVNSSYLIFINRKEPNWSTEIPPLLPPFKDD